MLPARLLLAPPGTLVPLTRVAPFCSCRFSPRFLQTQPMLFPTPSFWLSPAVLSLGQRIAPSQRSLWFSAFLQEVFGYITLVTSVGLTLGDQPHPWCLQWDP